MKRNIMMMLLLAGVGMFVGCDTPEENGPITNDEISIAPNKETFTSKGGTMEVVVTSSGEWTLDGEHAWISPSTRKGDDGDIVKFTVSANEDEQDKTAEFVFKTGTATDKLTLTLKAKVTGGVSADEVYISSESETLSKKGGNVEVIVTSTDSWTLSSKSTYDWVTPSATIGDDGDVVKFSVSPNDTTDEKTAEFTFTVGDATADFTIILKGGELYFLELESDDDVEFSREANTLEIDLKTNVFYRDLQLSLSNDGADWLKHRVTVQTATGAKMVFDMYENEGYDDLTTVVTITGDGDTEVTVDVTQIRTFKLEVEEDIYMASMAGEDLAINIDSNVEYEVIIADSDKSWITDKGAVDGVHTLTIGETTEMRDAFVTFKFEELSATIKIVQKESSLVNMAVNMKNNQASPNWSKTDMPSYSKKFTFETLIKPNSFDSPSVIMGTDKFHIDLGDGGAYPNNQLVLFALPDFGSGSGTKVSNASMKIELDEWIHLAVTFDNANVKIYIDGEEVASQNIEGPIDDTEIPLHTFKVSKSSQSFDGLMTEVRAWDKALSSDEINAENHFYTVEPSSANLVGYWKFDDGQGKTAKDYSTKNKSMTATNDLEWVAVSLP